MNLIITCSRHLEPEAEQEISQILEEMGDSEPVITITKMSGIITIDTTLEPTEITKKIREKILDEPWSIRYCLRIIPIQKVTETNVEQIREKVECMKDEISPDESYRILIEKRNSDISSKEIISKIAEIFKNKVSLEFPDKIILIEILGNKTGVSIIKNRDILSLEKTKRSISE